MLRLLLLVSFVLSFGVGCPASTEGEPSGPGVGKEGGPCNPDGECFGDLTCASDFCVDLVGGDGTTDGTPPVDAGSGDGAADGSEFDAGEENNTQAHEVTLFGAVEKGPFILGSTVKVMPVDSNGNPTGAVFTTATSDDEGRFSIAFSAVGYVALEATGFYFNEVSASLSSANLTLRAFHVIEASGTQNAFINIITHLSYERVKALVVSGMSFTDAILQAEASVKTILGVSTQGLDANIAGIEMNILGGDTDPNAYLFAVSSVLIKAAQTQGGGNAIDAQLQQLMNQISVDLADDGDVDSEFKDLLLEAQSQLDVEAIASALELRLEEINSSAAVPNLGRFIDSDLDGHPNAFDNCPNKPNPDQLDANGNLVGTVCDCDEINCPENNACIEGVCEPLSQCSSQMEHANRISNEISVQIALNWSTSYGDMDLHMTKKNDAGEYCVVGNSIVNSLVTTNCSTTSLDCYYGNCKPNSSSPPDWDDNGVNRSGGDPSLSIDDLSGYGPEILEINQLVNGSYLLGVHHFSAPSNSGPITNMVTLYLFGQPQAYFSKDLYESASYDGDFWPVFILNKTDDEICVEELLSNTLQENPVFCWSQAALQVEDCVGADCDICEVDADCGINASCFHGFCMRECVLHSQCEDGLVCSSGFCITPQCQDELDCRTNYDERYFCNDCGACELSPPVCVTEHDEPDNSIDDANAMTSETYTSLICRDDVDFVSFNVQSDKRYYVEVSFVGSSAEHIELALLDNNGLELNTSEISYYGEGSVSASHYGSEPLVWYVRIVANVTDADQWGYTVTLTETNAPPLIDGTDAGSDVDGGSTDGICDACECIADATDLFISEYIEGNGNNKAIEIYNGTSETVTLNGYTLQKGVNGAALTTMSQLNGTLESGEVYVICNGGASAEILAQCDQSSGAVSFNGNDAVALMKGSTTIDLIGQPGQDPGNGEGWVVGEGSTRNHTLVRASNIIQGTDDWTEGQFQWVVYPNGTFSYLGWHAVYECLVDNETGNDAGTVEVETDAGAIVDSADAGPITETSDAGEDNETDGASSTSDSGNLDGQGDGNGFDGGMINSPDIDSGQDNVEPECTNDAYEGATGNGTYFTANTIASGNIFDELSASICDGDMDHYAYTLAAGEALKATLTLDGNATDFDMAFLNSDNGELVLSSSGTGNTETLTYRSPEARTLIIRVKGYHNNIGDYSLRFDRLPPFVCPDEDVTIETLDLSSPFATSDLALCKDVPLVYKVTLQPYERLVSLVSFNRADLVLAMAVLSEDGSQTYREVVYHAGQGSITYQPWQEETVQLKIWGFVNTEGIVDLQIFKEAQSACVADIAEPNDLLGAAVPLPESNPWLTLCANDEDIFLVEVWEDKIINARIEFVHADGDLDMMLYGIDGTQVMAASDTVNNFEEIILTATVTGTYYLRIFSLANQTSTRYSLNVQLE